MMVTVFRHKVLYWLCLKVFCSQLVYFVKTGLNRKWTSCSVTIHQAIVYTFYRVRLATCDLDNFVREIYWFFETTVSKNYK